MARRPGTKWEKKDIGSLQKLNEKTIHPMPGGLIEEMAGDVKKTGLIAYYKGDGTPNDLVGSNNLTLNGGTNYTKTKYGHGFNFDGIDDYAVGGSNLGISGDAELSMSCWVYWNDAAWTSDFPSAMGMNNPGTANGGLSMTFQNGRPAIDFFGRRFRATSALAVQTLHHVVVTKKPGPISTTSRIYVNGVEVAGALEGTDSNPNIIDAVPIIGRLDATRWWKGEVDDARYYDHALTPQEVKNLYNGIEPALVAKYVFADNANDVKGSNNGTLINTTFTEDGYYGKAAKFNGTNSRISIAHSADFLFGVLDFAVQFDIRVTSGLTTTIIDKYDDFGWQIRLTGGKIAVVTRDGANDFTALVGNIALHDGKWHRITVKRIYSSQWVLLVDGVQDVTSASQTAIDYSTTQQINFGHSPWFGHWYSGDLDNVEFYNFAPSEDQTRKQFIDIHAGMRAVATTTEGDFVKDNLYVRDAENVRWVPDGTFKGTGAEIAALAANGMTFAGLVAYCTSAGGGFEAGDAYLRNSADDGWDRLPRSQGSIDTELGFRAQAKARFYDADNSHYIGLRAPAAAAVSVDFILPGSDGAAKDLLGTTGAGALAFFRPNMTPLHMDDTQSSQVCTGTEVTIKSYSLPANSYTRILVMAAGEWSDVFDASEDPDNFSTEIEIGASSKSVSYSAPQFTSGQVSDNSGDMRWFLMYSAVQAGPATVAVKGNHNGTDAKSIRCDTFYVFGMNY